MKRPHFKFQCFFWCFFSIIMLSFNFFWRKGMADFWYLKVFARLTAYFSWNLSIKEAFYINYQGHRATLNSRSEVFEACRHWLAGPGQACLNNRSLFIFMKNYNAMSLNFNSHWRLIRQETRCMTTNLVCKTCIFIEVNMTISMMTDIYIYNFGTIHSFFVWHHQNNHH